MGYTVLARRYRSQTFDEVVGQEPIARTLKAAIEQDKVAHAYLFCGTRGVGKTSMARVFAKALNGSGAGGNDGSGDGSRDGSRDGGGDGSGNEVDAAIMSGQDTDVIEIDGASNRGVDEARELIANSIYRPMRGPYKIYIIDEVHMLTREAFNALLKTMEEPPSHVKFILCTTEAQKVPATIQSRCQRFDFRAISTARIGEHIAGIIKSEGLKAEPELVHAVARLGNGSMRDALSLLDRLIAAGDKKLTSALLVEMLGLPDRDLISGLIDAIAAGDAGSVLESADELLRRGVSIDQLLDVLSDRLRDIMVLCACGDDTPLVELDDQVRTDEIARAGQFDAAGVVHMIAICESVQRNVKLSAAPRALFEAALVRLALTEKLADVTAVLAGSGAIGRAERKKR